MTKIAFVGVPAAGKTTIMRAFVEAKRKAGMDVNIIVSDFVINHRIQKEDPIIKQYEKEHGPIGPEIFLAENRCIALAKNKKQSVLEHLEQCFLLDIINLAQEGDYIDFGGRALLFPEVRKLLKEKGFVIIFLSATLETVWKRLENDEEWRTRPTYVTAEENNPGNGWRDNAIAHRNRIKDFEKIADHTISVDDKSVEDIVNEALTLLETYKHTEQKTNHFVCR